MSDPRFGRTPNLTGAVDLAQYAKQVSPQAGPAADDLTKTIDLYDSEVLAIEQVYLLLQEKAREGSHDYDAFDREIKERFQDIGFVVDVVWYHSQIESVKIPEIVVKARIERGEFDRDRMVHEVTNDLLGTGEGGVIKTDPAMIKAMEDGSYKGQGGHKH